jgi:hypothetical protein
LLTVGLGLFGLLICSRFVAFGLGAPLALTFSLLRRGRELLWVGVGLMVLLHHHALRRIRERAE